MLDNRVNERYIVDTPESIEFGYDVAAIGVRFIAALLDTSLFFAVMYVIWRVAIEDASDQAQQAFLISATLLLCLYYIVFERFWNGQTPGKRIMGIRVVQLAGRPVTLISSVIRNLIRLIDFFPALYGLGVLIMFIDKQSRRLGDLVASTLVVRDRQKVTLAMLLEGSRIQRVRTALSSGGATLPNIEALRANDMALVQDFLLRRNALPIDRRQRIAGQLAYALFGRLGYSVPGDPELFLQQANDQYLVFRGNAQIENREQRT